MSDIEKNLYGDDTDDFDGDSDKEVESTQKSKAQSSEEKRIRDLQSKADSEAARANKAEARLKALEEALKDKDAEAVKEKPVPDPASHAMNLALDLARDVVYNSDPRLADAGFSADDLTGSTPAEIRQSAKDLLARYEKIETEVRNKVLASMGMAPELAGAPPTQPRDFSNLSSDDFKKLMDDVIRGGTPR